MEHNKTLKQMNIAERAAFAARQVVLDELNFDPRRVPVDPDKMEDCLHTMSFALVILLAGQLSAMRPEGRQQLVEFILSNALAMVQAANLAGVSPKPSPIVTPTPKQSAPIINPNFKKD